MTTSQGELSAKWREIRRDAPEWRPPALAAIIVAPRPPDEILMAGGLIQHQLRRGLPVDLLALTDGAPAHPDAGRQSIAASRQAEQRAGVADLGLEPSRVHRLGLEDDGLEGSEHELTEFLTSVCDPSTLLVAPWTGDARADHEAVGRAALRAARAVGFPLVFGLLETWRRRSPSDLEGHTIVRIPVPAEDVDSRWSAMRRHVSQWRPRSRDHRAGLSIPALETLFWQSEHFILPGPTSRAGHR